MLSQDYYFISTSGPSDVQSRVGGFCQSHNMKVVFKVMSEDSLKRQKQKQEEEVKEQEGRDVFRINSEVRPMMDSIEVGNGEVDEEEDHPVLVLLKQPLPQQVE